MDVIKEIINLVDISREKSLNIIIKVIKVVKICKKKYIYITLINYDK